MTLGAEKIEERIAYNVRVAKVSFYHNISRYSCVLNPLYPPRPTGCEKSRAGLYRPRPGRDFKIGCKINQLTLILPDGQIIKTTNG